MDGYSWTNVVPDDSSSLDSEANIQKHSSRVPRKSVMLVATIEHTGTGLTTKHRVRDISSGGLRADNASRIEHGATVMISVGALEAVAATVKWVHDGWAGVAFVTPINPEVARQKAAIAPSVPDPKAIIACENPGAKAGWIEDLHNPYRK